MVSTQAGYATALDVALTTSFALGVEDSVTILLNNATGSGCGTAVAAGDCFRRLGRQDAPLQLGGADGHYFSGAWNRNTSTITLTTKLGDAYKFEDSRRTYALQVQYS